jgi:hypothetical protein
MSALHRAEIIIVDFPREFDVPGWGAGECRQAILYPFHPHPTEFYDLHPILWSPHPEKRHYIL